MRKTCLDMVYELAKRDDRVLFVGSRPRARLTFTQMKKTEMPDRFFMEGIAEANVLACQRV